MSKPANLPRLHTRLWSDNQDLAQACLEHPFVQGLASGTLAPAPFRAYVAQDAFFLTAFARAYAQCAANCEQLADYRRFHQLQTGVLEELETHAGFAAGMGIDLTSVDPFPETLAYTQFLLGTAQRAGLGETIAAMTPCMRLYAHLGQALAKDGIPEHHYADWIATYSSKDFEQLAVLLEGLLDQYGEDAPGTDAAYRRAMECEVAFFSAPLRAA